MKHTSKIILILLSMFFLTQLIGIAVVNTYSPEIRQVTTESGEIINITTYNLPYGLDPPQDIEPKVSLFTIIGALFFAIILMLLLMRIKAEIFIRFWFFFVVVLALGITFNAAFMSFESSSIIALALALPLAFIKIFKRHIVVHNLTELLVYPGIAAIFVSILNVWTVVVLLILISIYDMYAVWHTGFMQKMAQYQIQKVKVFSGFFIPYLGKRQRQNLKKIKISKAKTKAKKIKVNVAILGGGDVIFPIILAGVVLRALGLFQALLIAIGATLALAYLFYKSEKGKFYPAMPFITIGCFIALAIAYLI